MSLNTATGIWRFAPSPTGPLHLGSLVSALASYLDAKAHGGLWLLRMEDLDPPREMPGAADMILRSLEAHALPWDGPVLYQSQRLDAYEAALHSLRERGLVYPCYCSRKTVAAQGGIYPGTCRGAAPKDQAAAWRLKVCDLPAGSAPEPLLASAAEGGNWIAFDDIFLGAQRQNLQALGGDFIIKRRDGLFAYLLAVAVDDAFQSISEVVRGGDLLPATGQQIWLLQLMGAKVPRYGHVPLVCNKQGQKLSKQNHAPALMANEASANLSKALGFLGHAPPAELSNAPAQELVAWAVAHWQREQLAMHMHGNTQSLG